jgi:hypothetical protein
MALKLCFRIYLKRVQANHEMLKMKGANQISVHADDINLQGDST